MQIIYKKTIERMITMFKKDCCTSPEKVESTVTVIVDVTKIVKYVCFAGILIVGIIFGTKCYQNMFEQE